MTSTSLKALTLTVAVAAVVGAALLSTEGLHHERGTALVLLALAAVTGTRSVRIPRLRIQITAADMFTLCALATLAPAAAPMVALAGVLGALVGPSRRPPSLRTAFNLGVVTLSAAVAGWMYVGLGGSPATVTGPNFLALLVAAATFLAVNLALVALAVRLETGRSVFDTLASAGPWAGVGCLTSLLLALGLAQVLEAVGPTAIVLGLFCTGPLLTYFKAHRQRLESLAAASELEAAQKTLQQA